MKKCNYFSSLVVLLLLFSGMSLNAQSYLSSTDAVSAIQGVISQNTKKSAAINSNPIVGIGASGTAVKSYAALDRPEKVKLLKLEYGKSLLAELNAGIPVVDALNKVYTIYEIPSKRKGELDIFKEVEAFYRNLLSK